MDFNEIQSAISELEDAFLHVQQPRTDFVLKHFVVGEKDTLEEQYLQCVLEMQVKWDNIRKASLHRQKIEIQIKELEDSKSEIDHIDAKIHRIELEEQDRAYLGAVREFECLYKIWQSFPVKFTREQLNASQPAYWYKRLLRQANLDVYSSGRIGQGNADAIRMITGYIPTVQDLPKLEQTINTLQLNPPNQTTRELSTSIPETTVLLVVHTKQRKELTNISNLLCDNTIGIKKVNFIGDSLEDSLKSAAELLLQDNADLLIVIDQDFLPPTDLINRWINYYRNNINVLCALNSDNKVISLMNNGVTPTNILNLKCFMITHEILSKLGNNCFSEDINNKIHSIGYDILCDTSIMC